MGEPQRAEEHHKQSHSVDTETDIYGQTEGVDTQTVKPSTNSGGVGDDKRVDSEEEGSRNRCRIDNALGGHLRILLEVVDEDQSGDSQQVKDVDTNRQTHQVGNQHQPTCACGVVGCLLPFQNSPEDHCRKERRHRINLRLDSREPEGVGKGVGERADKACSHHCPESAIAHLLKTLRTCQATAEVGDGPEEEHNGKC